MVLCKEMDFGKIKKDRSLLDVGGIIKLTAMEFIQHSKVTFKVHYLLI